MAIRSNRRSFLRTAAAGSILTASDWAALTNLAPTRAAAAEVTPDLLRFDADFEPLVRLIEDTPRDKCPSVLIEKLRAGLPYRNFLAALYMAAIRAAKWHGGMHGFDHMAYVVYSAEQLSLDLNGAERLLPAFWVLDGFKATQEVYPNVKRPAALVPPFPNANRAVEELHVGLKQWNPEQAERAIVTMVRNQGASQVIEPLWHYAARDWRFIGHLAILVANSWRLLQTVGWRHAELVMRYVVEGLAGWPKDDRDGPDHQPYSKNVERVARIASGLPADWANSGENEGITKELLARVRHGCADDACELAATSLTDGKCQAGAVWDAVHLATAELMRASKYTGRWNSMALHANTAINSLHYGFEVSFQTDNRLLLLLQALAWAGLFRDALRSAQQLDEREDITRIQAPEDGADAASTVSEILALRTDNPRDAGTKAFALANRDGGMSALFQFAGRNLAVRGAANVHDIKLFVAAREDVRRVSPRWAPHVATCSVFGYHGAAEPDHEAIAKVRDALRGR